MSKTERLLTTTDNPYNPHSHFDEWYAFDIEKGYNTLSYLDRVMNNSNDLPEPLQDRIYDDAINEILEYNVLGIYMIAPLPVN